MLTAVIFVIIFSTVSAEIETFPPALASAMVKKPKQFNIVGSWYADSNITMPAHPSKDSVNEAIRFSYLSHKFGELMYLHFDHTFTIRFVEKIRSSNKQKTTRVVGKGRWKRNNSTLILYFVNGEKKFLSLTSNGLAMTENYYVDGFEVRVKFSKKV